MFGIPDFSFRSISNVLRKMTDFIPHNTPSHYMDIFHSVNFNLNHQCIKPVYTIDSFSFFAHYEKLVAWQLSRDHLPLMVGEVVGKVMKNLPILGI